MISGSVGRSTDSHLGAVQIFIALLNRKLYTSSGRDCFAMTRVRIEALMLTTAPLAFPSCNFKQTAFLPKSSPLAISPA